MSMIGYCQAFGKLNRLGNTKSINAVESRPINVKLDDFHILLPTIQYSQFKKLLHQSLYI